MLTEIINIGDELLIGQVINSNAAYLGQELNALGVKVFKMSSIQDSKDEILRAIEEGFLRADLLIMTGGLGPTKDDVTKKSIAELFGVGIRRDENVLQHVQEIFKKYNRPMLDINMQQADVPENAQILFNHWGTAPGMWFEYKGKYLVSLPGVPYEMMNIFQNDLKTQLLKVIPQNKIYHRIILTVGMGESFLAKTIEDIEDALPEYIKLAYLPKSGQVRLRLSCYQSNDAIEQEIEQIALQLTERLESVIVAQEDVTLPEAILNQLKAKGLSLSIAESCTGGFLSHQLTSIPGSSKVFKGSLVPYDNAIKEQVLGVNTQTLAQRGAVSEATVSEMLKGCLNLFQSDIAIAISGIAGPDGGTEEKPVGTVFIGISNHKRELIKRFTFTNLRQVNIERSATQALAMLFQEFLR
jgi:nicotinamide-nucleotide amidase